ncbi:MAG: hypothetical protein ACR2NJ_05765 [Acidimicrobiales bacterium]
MPQSNETADRATEAFDNLMVNLVGAFDAAARVAHLAVGLEPSDRHQAGWQRRQWRSKVAAVAKPLADVFASNSPASDLFVVCRVLRNTVHGEGLQTSGIASGGGPSQTRIALPEDDAQDLACILDRLGGKQAWGLRDPACRRPDPEPLTFVERLLPDAFRLLNELLRLTPVEQLSGVDAAELTVGPPEDLQFGLGTRTRASLLLGLSSPAL